MTSPEVPPARDRSRPIRSQEKSYLSALYYLCHLECKIRSASNNKIKLAVVTEVSLKVNSLIISLRIRQVLVLGNDSILPQYWASMSDGVFTVISVKAWH